MKNTAEKFASPPHFKLKKFNFYLLQYVMITDQKQTCHHGHNQHIHLGHLKMGELRSQTCSLSFFSLFLKGGGGEGEDPNILQHNAVPSTCICLIKATWAGNQRNQGHKQTSRAFSKPGRVG